jgi:hypothetical protein
VIYILTKTHHGAGNGLENRLLEAKRYETMDIKR